MGQLHDMEAGFFEDVWRVGCFGGFLVGREAVRRMLPRGRGTVIFTGATASLRGKPATTAFASAKAGLRSLAQSMARAYGPQGIHVAHVVVDGGIAGDKIIQGLPQFAQAMGEDGLVSLERSRRRLLVSCTTSRGPPGRTSSICARSRNRSDAIRWRGAVAGRHAMSEKVCVVAGVGPGTGTALSRRFAAGGYRVAMLARDASASPGSNARSRAAAATPSTSPTRRR